MGFYVLLLFDIVLCIQVENLTAITESEQTMAAYLQNSFFSAGYLMAASIVALKCLNLVPDLAAWMIFQKEIQHSLPETSVKVWHNKPRFQLRAC